MNFLHYFNYYEVDIEPKIDQISLIYFNLPTLKSSKYSLYLRIYLYFRIVFQINF